jgi:hypothetical protein
LNSLGPYHRKKRADVGGDLGQVRLRVFKQIGRTKTPQEVVGGGFDIGGEALGGSVDLAALFGLAGGVYATSL